MRLIDADKTIGLLKTRLYETALNNATVNCDASYLYTECADNRIAAWINEQPTVDAESVVRCKDCKYYIADGCDECALMSAKSIIASINNKRWHSDFYCAWGERRED